MFSRNPRPYVHEAKRRRRRPALLFILLLCLLVGLALFWPGEERRSAARTSPLSAQPLPGPFPAGPFQQKADWAASMKQAEVRLEKNQTLGQALDRLGLDQAQAFDLTEAASEVMDMKKVQPGAALRVFRDIQSGRPVRFECDQGLGDCVLVVSTPEGYVATRQDYPPITNLVAEEGTIRGSLWESAVEKQGLDPEVVLSFSDIFSYDVDFSTDVQEGDSFKILFEKHYRRGEYLGSGRVLAATFTNEGRQLTAFYFANRQGEGGYYDETGRALRKMFLKSPLRFRRISSFFSLSRFHPILKIRRPHLGVDYSAPKGTPVETVADGVVVFLGTKGGYGRFVQIRHGQGYTTSYAHLSRFAKGLKAGQRVVQGDLVGYVGATGLATGPHLDFRVSHTGRFIDPLSIKQTPAPAIKASDKKLFSDMVQQAQAAMERRLAAQP